MFHSSDIMDDPLIPHLVVHDKNVPVEKQQCLLKPSEIAKSLVYKDTGQKDKDLRNPATAINAGTIFIGFFSGMCNFLYFEIYFVSYQIRTYVFFS